MLDEQYRLEQEMFDKGSKIVFDNINKADTGKADTTPYLALVKRYIEDLSIAIAARIEDICKKKSRNYSIQNKLNLLSADKLAYITLNEALRCGRHQSRTTTALYNSIGLSIEHAYICDTFKKNNPALFKTISKDLDRRRTSDERHRRRVLINKNDQEHTPWESSEKIVLGTILVKELVALTDILDMSRRGYVSVSEDTYVWLDKYTQHIADYSMSHMPCVERPLNWTNNTDGGYHLEHIRRINPLCSKNKEYFTGDYTEHLDCINALQGTRWQVNTRLLDVVNQIWNSKDTTLFQSREPIRVPTAPIERGVDKNTLSEEELARFNVWKADARKAYTSEATRFTKIINDTATLALANRFKKYDNLYYVYYADYRGRIYPSCTYLSPQGTGLSKALLQFSEGVTLSEDGVTWLAVHGANVYGVDKVSYKERIEFICSITEDIKQYVQDPLRYKGWMDADSPWQFLAFCFEWEEYMRTGTVQTHIPIAMDGTCNGLQHLSAMLKDEVGAKYTNLLESDKPTDIYAEVADKLTKTLEKIDHPLAKRWLELGVTRSVCKRPVMTLPYGVVKEALSQQIIEYLDKEYPDLDKSWDLAQYIAPILWDTMNQTVRAATELLEYIRKEARSTFDDKPYTWTSPTGFPVVVHTPKYKTVQIQYQLGSIRYRPRLRSATDTLDKRKCIAALAPNLVHSIDASHLVKTVNNCVAHGVVDFAVIHDSYGVHANHTAVLHRAIREEFVNIYSEDILTSCITELGFDTDELPDKGNLNISNVYNGTYFFN